MKECRNTVINPYPTMNGFTLHLDGPDASNRTKKGILISDI